MKKYKLLKLHWFKVLAMLLFVLLFGVYSNVFAAPTPDEIIDSNCPKGEVGCILKTSIKIKITRISDSLQSTSTSLASGWSAFTYGLLNNITDSITGTKEFAVSVGDGAKLIGNGIIYVSDRLADSWDRTTISGSKLTASVGNSFSNIISSGFNIVLFFGDSLTSISDGLASGWSAFTYGLLNNITDSITGTKEFAVSVGDGAKLIGNGIREGWTSTENFVASLFDKKTNSLAVAPIIKTPTPITAIPPPVVSTLTPPIPTEIPTSVEIIPVPQQIIQSGLTGQMGPRGEQGLRGLTGLQGPRGEAGRDGNIVDTSSFVSKTFLDKQVSGIFDSISNSTQGLSSSLSEEVVTNLLTVSGNATIGGDVTITGNITGNVVGIINPSFTLGSIPFQGATGLAEDNANLFYNQTNSRLGIGTKSPVQKLDVAGSINISSGSTYMYNGVNVITAQTALNNYFFGNSGNLTMTGGNNSATGTNAFISNTTGTHNVANGSSALRSNTTGYQNVANGSAALYDNTIGYLNTANGVNALTYNIEGVFNTADGANALYSNTTGNYNTANGYFALYSNVGGNHNTAIGSQAGYNGSLLLQTMADSTFLGYGANSSANGITNSMALGNGAQVTKSNQVVIGNASVAETLLRGNVGIGTTNPTAILQLKAGTATANTAPLKFTSGTNLTTAEVGAMEYSGNILYFTPSGTTRKTVAYTDSAITSSMYIGTTSVALNRGTGTLTLDGITLTSPDITTSITTSSASFTAFAGATTLLTIGGTGASASLFAPSTLDATSSITGAIRTSGGISALKAANFGTTLTVGTSATIPIIYGGLATGSTLSLISTSGTGSNDAVYIKGGTNGDTTIASFFGAGTYAGNVGIGTTAPTEALYVSGNIYATGDITCGGTCGGGGSSQWTTATGGIYYDGGNVGIGTTTPTAVLHLKAGTDAVNTAPLKLTSGINLTTTEAGAIEYDGSHLYFTAIDAGTRYQLDQSSPITVVNSSNLFSTGLGAGSGVTSTTFSNFFGINAGKSATSASNSNFLGYFAGSSATSAAHSNFLGYYAGGSAPSASNSNFLGRAAGYLATSAAYSNFLGYYAGSNASNASYSNLFGYNVGMFYTGNNIGSNNIIIGTNISLPNNTANAMNLGGVLFATGTYATTSGDPSITAVSGGKVGIGTASPLTLTEIQGGLTTVGSVLTLSSKETSTVANDILGRINFRAALDASGTDAILTGASVAARAEGTFSASSNATSLDFQTGSSEVATTKMTIMSSGNVGIGTTAPTSKLHLAAGSATAGTAPLGFTSGTLLTVPVSGKVEFLTDAYYGTITTGAARKQFAFTDSNITGTSANISGGLGGQILYQSAVNTTSKLANGTAGQVLTSAGTTLAPTWATPPITIVNSSNLFSTGLAGTGSGVTTVSYSNFLGSYAGSTATSASNSNFLGQNAGNGAANASNSIFIGQSAGNGDTVNNTTNADDFSILIGKSTSTGGFSNSIAIGGSATNTASNQFMIGSATRPINTTVWNGTGGVTCTFTTAVGAMTCASDISLKKNIITLNNKPFELRTNLDVLSSDTLNKILTLTPVTYNWNYELDTDPTHIGFIAQEVKQIFPDLVSQDINTKKLSLNVTGLTPYLVQAIQEMNLRVSDLSNLDTTSATSLGSLIKRFLADVGNGIGDFYANRVRTKQICVAKADGTEFCVDGDKLEEMAKNSTGSTGGNTSGNTGGETGGSTGGSTGDTTCVSPSTMIAGVCTAPTCDAPSTIIDGICTAPAGDDTTTSDISALTTLKTTVEGLITANATESETPGNHIVGSLATLTAANNLATGTTADTQAIINAEVTALNDAITAYNATIVPTP